MRIKPELEHHSIHSREKAQKAQETGHFRSWWQLLFLNRSSSGPKTMWLVRTLRKAQKAAADMVRSPPRTSPEGP
jgi:hypothetical protein